VIGSPAYNPGWNLSLELESMLVISEAVTRSALQRTESRGAHARIDHPDLDAEWGSRNSTVALDGDQMRVTAEPLPPMPDDLRQLITT
jgi:succinate dehydrogenase / fumarate reductase flavoprotein subunit